MTNHNSNNNQIKKKIIRVISTFTTIQGSGQVDLEIQDNHDTTTMTIQDIKTRVESLTNVPATRQSIWWKGYILDDNSQTIQDAIRQFSGQQHSQSPSPPYPTHDESVVVVLTLYMTVPVEERYQKRLSSTTTSIVEHGNRSSCSSTRHRLSSWDFKLEDVKLLLEQKTSSF
jgi:hypothetical protein